MKTSQLKELENIVASVKSGQQFVLFPPGIIVVIVSIITLIVATVLLTGGLISNFAADILPSQKAIIQFIAILCILVFIILPNLLLFKGRKKYIKIQYYYSIAMVFVSGLVLLNQVLSHSQIILLFILSLVCALIAERLMKSNTYLLCMEFYYLLKKTD